MLQPVLRELRQSLRAVLLFSLVINLALLTPSIFMLQVFDRVLVTRSVETLLMLGVVAITALVLMGWLDRYRAMLLAGAGIRLEQRVGPGLLSRLVQTSARQGSRGYVDGLRDLSQLRAFVGGPGFVALCDAPWTLVYLVVIFLFHPALGLLATVCTVVLFALAFLGERVTRSHIGQLRSSTHQVARLAETMIRQAETVSSMGLPRALGRRWEQRSHTAQGALLELQQPMSVINSLSRVLRQAVQVLMLGYGTYLVVHDNATPGIMLATTIILGRALAPMEVLIGSWRNLVEALDGYRRLNQLPAESDGASRLALPRPAADLRTESVTYTPPGAGRPILRAAALQAEAATVLAIIGPSGAGKTTLARVIAGVLAPDSGTVRLGGVDVHASDSDSVGEWIGYLPQEVVLFEGTVAENIARMNEPDAEAVLAAARLAGVHELLLGLPQGYDTPIAEAGRNLSAGQRQRIGLARAVYRQPVLVVLDEPDASLDAEGEQSLLNCIQGLRAAGSTVVVSTQRRGVLGVADQVLVLREGVVSRVAPAEAGAAGTSAVSVRPAPQLVNR